MIYSNLSVRIEEPVKESFNNLCERMGMNASVAVNIFVRTMLREKKMPFEVKDFDPFYSNTTQKRLANAYKQLKDNKGNIYELIEDDSEEIPE
ncbi:MAG: type II toxin-antitoxin system RelB/DinJ family antitoxin [Novosphingobium sp.]|nr:type II toxin-antitoxin system RelB/DinJ family antitoxin [Novosphingobium sp.]